MSQLQPKSLNVSVIEWLIQCKDLNIDTIDDAKQFMATSMSNQLMTYPMDNEQLTNVYIDSIAKYDDDFLEYLFQTKQYSLAITLYELTNNQTDDDHTNDQTLIQSYMGGQHEHEHVHATATTDQQPVRKPMRYPPGMRKQK